MTVRQLRSAVLSIVQAYFVGASVVWGKTNKTFPHLPVVFLEFGTVKRPIHPEVRDTEGELLYYYPSQVSLTVNLCTKGAAITQEGMTNAYENTAESDLLDFINFINSEVCSIWCNARDISIRPEGSVQDLSELENDAKWQYRAMAELAIDFTQLAVGMSGILAEASVQPDGTIIPVWQQTPSGGGSQELAEKETGYFTQVEITYKGTIRHGTRVLATMLILEENTGSVTDETVTPDETTTVIGNRVVFP